ncbi:hypothetical protein [Vibrio phage BUCT006]|nr:hypothetical protein [Vibrio phage BUCT006]
MTNQLYKTNSVFPESHAFSPTAANCHVGQNTQTPLANSLQLGRSVEEDSHIIANCPAGRNMSCIPGDDSRLAKLI